jgi:predicted GIY-YIG superfamily endonuclease
VNHNDQTAMIKEKAVKKKRRRRKELMNSIQSVTQKKMNFVPTKKEAFS